ncbi:MAG: TolC family protein [Lachnospiraceae bacterium]|nr:TolC family protein [Lachnospiraceae bacterium]
MKHILLSAMAACSLFANAETWSLEKCIDHAIENNITVKLRRADLNSSELEVTEAKSRYLPTLSANVGQSWNLGRGLTAENTYADRNTSNLQWGASLNLPLFSGMSTTRRVNLAKANLSTVMEQYEAAKEDITLNVIGAYLQVLYCKELNEVALYQVDLSKHELASRSALLEAGKIPEIDMLEARSQLAQDEMNLSQTKNDVALALVDLSQLLELGDIAGFDIEPIEENELNILSPDEVYSAALQRNHSLIAARNNITAADRNISLAKSGYLPTLSFNAGIGSSYYRISDTKNESFGRQMKNNYSTYFGLSLNIPIFDALSTRNSIRRAKVQKVTAMLNYDDARQRVFKAIQQAYYQADGAKNKLKASEVADETANAAFKAMQEKYNLGRATPTEYEQSKAKALKATADRIQARYELILRTRILAFYAKQ